MKRQLTFPLIRMIFKVIGLFGLFIMISIAIAFFPESPRHLTLIDENEQQYHTACPELSSLQYKQQKLELPASFTFLNWNIYKQQKNNWEVTLQKWVTTADLITLQEAKYSPELIQFSKKMDLFYLQNYAFKHKAVIYGVNTFSRVPPTSACATRHREPWFITYKTAIASTYPIKNNEHDLLVINLHGINFTLTKKSLMTQIAPYLALIEQHSGPVIFSGDFNTWSEARLKGVEDALSNIGFSEIILQPDQRSHVFGLPLDHIYFRGLIASNTKSLKTEASDHTPLVVTFKIKR